MVSEAHLEVQAGGKEDYLNANSRRQHRKAIVNIINADLFNCNAETSRVASELEGNQNAHRQWR